MDSQLCSNELHFERGTYTRTVGLCPAQIAGQFLPSNARSHATQHLFSFRFVRFHGSEFNDSSSQRNPLNEDDTICPPF